MTFASLTAALMNFDTITKNGTYWVKVYLHADITAISLCND